MSDIYDIRSEFRYEDDPEGAMCREIERLREDLAIARGEQRCCQKCGRLWLKDKPCPWCEIERLRERIEELEALHRETVEEINAQDGILITSAQIDAAWENRQVVFSPDNPDGPVMLIAEELGIKQCGGCEECEGDGWYIEEADDE